MSFRKTSLHDQGGITISDKTSDHKISQSLHTGRFELKLSDRSEIWQLPKKPATSLLVKFQSVAIIEINTPRLRNFMVSCDKTS